MISHLESDMSYATGVCLFEEGPSDTDPPVISNPSADPRIAPAGNEITISAMVADEQSGVASAEATIRDALGAEVTTLPMTNTTG